MKIKMYVCFLLAILFISCKKETPSHGNSVTKDTKMESGREAFYEDGRLILCGAECWKFGEKVIYRCINGDGLYEMKSFDVTDFKK